MSDAPRHNGVSDINPQKWIVRAAPKPLRPYVLLMRLDRPGGVWLVMAPGWWAIALASPGPWPDLSLLTLFALGALIMRGAGSVINDIIDADLDAQVARTAHRPIPAGLATKMQAWVFAALLCAIGLLILLQLNSFAILVGAAAIVTVLIYPYAKRFTHWPQFFLGLSACWGALLGWAAVRGDLTLAPGLLYAGGIFWTLGWDTIYGHQDKHDDARVGIKSGALYLGKATPIWLGFFYTMAIGLIGAAGWLADMGPYFYPALVVASAHLVWQVATLDLHNPENCLARFCSNRDFGLLVFIAVMLGRLGS